MNPSIVPWCSLLFTALLTVPVQAQQRPAAEQEVLSVIDRFFGYMTARDTAGMATILEAEGSFGAVGIDAGAPPPRMVSHERYIAGLTQGNEALLERYWDAEVRMDRGVAVVTCPYDFHVDGVLSHCGLDIFTLVKHPDGWRIAGAVFSMQREGCALSPLGPVKK
jgi:hypothetical protein